MAGARSRRCCRGAFPWCEDWAEELRGLFREFGTRKQANAVLDYDDLLLYWHALMQEPVLAAEVGGRFDHVLVDEYQDVNRLQADIVLALKPGGAGIDRGRRRCAGDLFLPRGIGRRTSWSSRIDASRRRR